MKKLLFILLMAITATAFSQVSMFRIDKVTAFDTNEDGETIGERITYIKPVIIFDVSKALVTITYENSNQVRFILITELSDDRIKDSDGDYFNVVKFGAIDDGGLKCKVLFQIYEEFSNVFIIVIYSNTTYVFHGNYISTTN